MVFTTICSSSFLPVGNPNFAFARPPVFDATRWKPNCETAADLLGGLLGEGDPNPLADNLGEVVGGGQPLAEKVENLLLVRSRFSSRCWKFTYGSSPVVLRLNRRNRACGGVGDGRGSNLRRLPDSGNA